MKDLRKSLTACLLVFVLLLGGCAMLQDAAGNFRLDLSGVFGGERESDDDGGDE